MSKAKTYILISCRDFRKTVYLYFVDKKDLNTVLFTYNVSPVPVRLRRNLMEYLNMGVGKMTDEEFLAYCRINLKGNGITLSKIEKDEKFKNKPPIDEFLD